jgi:hypothetical protein
MLFVQRELSRIQGALTSATPPKCYAELYAAQQALAWVLDSDTFKAPHAMLARRTQEDLGGCPGESDLSLSSDNRGLHAV